MSIPVVSCDWRVEIPDDGRYFCRHTGIVARCNLVSRMVCGVCPVRTSSCESPRDIPAPDALKSLTAECDSIPPIAARVWNLTAAIKDFVMDGMKTVETEEYARRLKVCEACEFRKEDNCLQCGCNLTIKARGRAFHCPLQLW